MSSGFRFDAEKLLESLVSLPDKTDQALEMYAATSAIKLQTSAQEKARWTDRTGAARQRLKGDHYRVATGYRLRLAHGVDYGVWLELAHEKRFAIIAETVRDVGTFEIMPGLAKLIERLSL